MCVATAHNKFAKCRARQPKRRGKKGMRIASKCENDIIWRTHVARHCRSASRHCQHCQYALYYPHRHYRHSSAHTHATAICYSPLWCCHWRFHSLISFSSSLLSHCPTLTHRTYIYPSTSIDLRYVRCLRGCVRISYNALVVPFISLFVLLINNTFPNGSISIQYCRRRFFFHVHLSLCITVWWAIER